MIGQLIGPIASIAGGWLQGKADVKAAEAKLKLTEAEAKAKIMLSKETSIADWERIMAQGSQNSWKDEWLTILFSIPLVLVFLGDTGRQVVADGFAALETMPDWYQYTLGVIVAASFGVRSATKFFGRKQLADPKKGTGKKPKKSGRRLYTDENPKDTVSIKYATEKDARDTVAKVKKINKPFARKIQILTVLEQRAKVAGKMKQAQIAKRGKEAIRKKRGKA